MPVPVTACHTISQRSDDQSGWCRRYVAEDNNLSYSVQTGYAGGGDGNSGSTGYATLNYRGGYGNANIGYSHSDDIKQLYHGVSGGYGSCQWRNAGSR
ncbi:fimbria/pilus outer membrane usher protein [Escherichia coli]